MYLKITGSSLLNKLQANNGLTDAYRGVPHTVFSYNNKL